MVPKQVELSKLCLFKINKNTGMSVLLDKDHYEERTKGEYDYFLYQCPKNPDLYNIYRKPAMQLAVAGVGHVASKFILERLYNIHNITHNESSYRVTITYWCAYYSNHLNDLYKLIGDNWQVEVNTMIKAINPSYDIYKVLKENIYVNKSVNKPLTPSIKNEIFSILERLNDLINSYSDQSIEDVKSRRAQILNIINTNFSLTIEEMNMYKEELLALNKTIREYYSLYVYIDGLQKCGFLPCIRQYYATYSSEIINKDVI